jgi:hypothetical protein
MGDRKTELKRKIAVEREELSGNIAELEGKAKDLVDWRAQFAAHPLPMLAAAFGGGLLLATALSGNGSNGSAADEYDDEDEYDDDEEVEEDEVEDEDHHHDASYAADVARRRRRSSNGNAHRVWDEVKGALIGLAATKAIGMLDGVIPGIESEMRERRRRR